MERGVQEIPRAISGEHPPGSVRAVGAGSQPQDQQLRVGVAEASQRLAPILVTAIRASLLDRDFFAVRHQPRARVATLDLTPEQGETARAHADSSANIMPENTRSMTVSKRV